MTFTLSCELDLRVAGSEQVEACGQINSVCLWHRNK